jgi:DNA-binding transcriptional ArsR family regulator
MPKSTISYHTKVLQEAGLLLVRREGHHNYCTVRRDVLEEMQDQLWRLAIAPRPTLT